MDQGWKGFPLLVVLLMFWRSAFGFPGGVHSNTGLWLDQTSDDTLSPHEVQSLSEAPVIGRLSDQVGYGFITDGHQKSRSKFAYEHQYVKGDVSSSNDATSRTQTVPSGSVSVALAQPQGADSLALLHQVSTSSSVPGVSSQLTSGLSLPSQYPSAFSQTSPVQQSAGGSSQNLPLLGVGSNVGFVSSPVNSRQYMPNSPTKRRSSPLMVSSKATSYQNPHNPYVSGFVGGSVPFLDASGSVSGQGAIGSSGDLSVSQGPSSQFAPGAATRLVSSTSEVSSQPARDKGFSSLYHLGSFPQTDAALSMHSGLSFSPPIQSQGLVLSQGSFTPEQPVSSGQLVSKQEVSGGSSQEIPTLYSPSSLTTSKLGSLAVEVFSQPTSVYLSSAPSQSSTVLAASSYIPVQTGSSYGDLSFPKPQGSSAQFAPATKYVNVAVTTPKDVSTQSGSSQGLYRPVAQVVASPQTRPSSQFVSPQGGSSAYSGTLAQSQVGSSECVFEPSKSISSQAFSSQPINIAGPQGVSSTTVGASSSFRRPVQSQGTFSQFAPGSPSKFSSSRVGSSQSTSDPGLYSQYSPTSLFGPQTGKPAQFTSSLGEGSACSSYLPQSQSASSELSFGSFKPIPPRTVSTQQTSVASSQGSSGTTLAGSSRFASQAKNSGFSGSVQSQGKSSLRLVSSQSSSDPALYGQLSRVGSPPQKRDSHLLAASQGSDCYSGSLTQSQEYFGHYAPSSPSKYVPMSSPQSVSRQAAAAPTSHGGFASTFFGGFGSQSGSSLPLQGSSAHVGSTSQPQGTMSQFASGSPSKYASASLSSAQGASSQYGRVSQSMYSVSQSQRPQRPQPSTTSWNRGIQAAAPSKKSQMPSRLSSPFSPGNSGYPSVPQEPSRGSGQLVSRQGGSGGYGGVSLQSSTLQSGQTSTSAAVRPQSPLGRLQWPTRLFSSPGSTAGSQVLQRSTDSSLTPSLSSSGHRSAMGMFSGSSLPQTAQTPGRYSSESYNQGSGTSVAKHATFQMFSSNYGRDAPVSKNYSLRRDTSVKG